MRKSAWSVLLIFGFLFVTGCEDEEQANLFNAQYCLDRATATNALSCVSNIEGQTDERASVLKCGARFLSRGIDTDTIVAAIEVISDEGNNANATSTAIANLAIPNSAANPTSYDVAFAQEIATVCAQTQSDGLIALSSFALISTSTNALLSTLVPGSCTVPYTAQCVTQGLDSFDPNTADSSTIGQTAIQNQEALCGENGTFKGEDICTDIDAAIAAGGDADAVGDALLNGIKNDND